MFSQYQIDQHMNRPLTFYGEQRNMNDDNNLIEDQEMKKQEVEEVEQAISAVKKEEIQKHAYNRFKE